MCNMWISKYCLKKKQGAMIHICVYLFDNQVNKNRLKLAHPCLQLFRCRPLRSLSLGQSGTCGTGTAYHHQHRHMFISIFRTNCLVGNIPSSSHSNCPFSEWLQGSQIFAGFAEFALFHALAHVVVDERTLASVQAGGQRGSTKNQNVSEGKVHKLCVI